MHARFEIQSIEQPHTSNTNMNWVSRLSEPQHRRERATGSRCADLRSTQFRVPHETKPGPQRSQQPTSPPPPRQTPSQPAHVRERPMLQFCGDNKTCVYTQKNAYVTHESALNMMMVLHLNDDGLRLNTRAMGRTTERIVLWCGGILVMACETTVDTLHYMFYYAHSRFKANDGRFRPSERRSEGFCFEKVCIKLTGCFEYKPFSRSLPVQPCHTTNQLTYRERIFTTISIINACLQMLYST